MYTHRCNCTVSKCTGKSIRTHWLWSQLSMCKAHWRQNQSIMIPNDMYLLSRRSSFRNQFLYQQDIAWMQTDARLSNAQICHKTCSIKLYDSLHSFTMDILKSSMDCQKKWWTLLGGECTVALYTFKFVWKLSNSRNGKNDSITQDKKSYRKCHIASYCATSQRKSSSIARPIKHCLVELFNNPRNSIILKQSQGKCCLENWLISLTPYPETWLGIR